MADISNNQKNTTGIEDVSTGHDLKVNSDGSINAAIIQPPAPVDATPVNVSAFGDVASTSGEYTYYTITNGKELTIQYLLAGAEYDSAGSVVELFYDAAGDFSSPTRLSTQFVNAASVSVPVQQSYTGNGTRRIVLRRRGYTATAREMFAQWIGYEV